MTLAGPPLTWFVIGNCLGDKIAIKIVWGNFKYLDCVWGYSIFMCVYICVCTHTHKILVTKRPVELR